MSNNNYSFVRNNYRRAHDNEDKAEPVLLLEENTHNKHNEREERTRVRDLHL